MIKPNVEVDQFFIKEKLEDGLICMFDIPTREQWANVKWLPKGLFTKSNMQVGDVRYFWANLVLANLVKQIKR